VTDPEPVKKPPARVMLAVRVAPAGIAAFRAAAKKRGLSQSEAMRIALADWTRRNS